MKHVVRQSRQDRRRYGRPLLALVMLCAIIAAIALLVGLPRPAAHATNGDWPMFLGNDARTNYNSAETSITAAAVKSLKLNWTYPIGAEISTQPIVANGQVYWGSWNGNEYATDLTGKKLWIDSIGGQTPNCNHTQIMGVGSSTAIATIPINGTNTTVAFVGGRDASATVASLFALNAATGAVIWETKLSASTGSFSWGSPVVYNGSVYMVVASFDDCPLVPGSLVQLNATTGTIEHTFYAAPTGCAGGTIWSSPAIDDATGTIYVTTGNSGTCPSPEIYGQAFVELNASDLSVIASWQVPASQHGIDSDFGASATLFTATYGGTLHQMVGAVNKNGIYYALDRNALSSGPVWTFQTSTNTTSVSSSAWDGTSLYVAGRATTIGGKSCKGSLRALNPATGKAIWEDCLQDGEVLAPVSAIRGVVFVGEGPHMLAIDAASGQVLFNYPTNGNVYAAATISNGVVYIGSNSGTLYALGLPSGLTPTPNLSPTPPPLPPVSGQVSKVWYFAEGRAGGGFKEFLTLGNPTGNACQVTITYLTQPDRGTGGTKTVSVTVPASKRVTEWVDGDLGTSPTGPGISDAATVSVNTAATPTCSGIVAERPMYFNALGTNGGSDVVGVTHTSTTFFFANIAVGSQAGGGTVSSFLPILNPGNTAAVVTATYYANGATVGTQTLTVAANSRGTIFPSQASPRLPSRVSVVLTSTQPVVSERPTYFSGITGGNAGIVSGGADVIGVQQLATDWLFAEGYTGGHFQENFVLANLDPAKKPATVTITLEYDNGTSHAFPVTVQPLSQVIWNVNANGAGATSQSVSAEITSSGAAIAVEREMYFGYNHVADGRTSLAMGGTDVLGQVGPAAKSNYSFAEGYTNLGYDEWLTIQNPTNNTETVTVTVSNAMGTVYTFAVQVVGHSRYTVDMVAMVIQHMFHSGDGYNGYEISLAVQSSNGPFVVERPMYWNASGTQGGSDVIGYSGG